MSTPSYFKQQWFRTLSLAALLAMQASCATVSTPPPAPAPASAPLADIDLEQAWQAHQLAVTQLQDWNLRGRISIKAGQDGWHAALNWKQAGASYAIDISTPLGQDVVRLQGNADGVTMRTSDGLQRAANPETLLYNRVGWRIPLIGMRYWALGLPDPDANRISPRDRELDTLGRLAKLRQSGWEIDFRRYVKVGEIDLPDKIFMSNQAQNVQLEVRLVVEKWATGAASLPVK